MKKIILLLSLILLVVYIFNTVSYANTIHGIGYVEYLKYSVHEDKVYFKVRNTSKTIHEGYLLLKNTTAKVLYDVLYYALINGTEIDIGRDSKTGELLEAKITRDNLNANK